MLHDTDLIEDFDQEYTSKVFRARKRLLATVESSTQLPDSGLSARNMLDDAQMQKVAAIRKRRLEPVLSRFIPD